MHSFGWKRKCSDTPKSAKLFQSASDEEELDSSIDWLTATKKTKVFFLEDGIAKSKRLNIEATLLAENERWWEAIKKWNAALSYTADSHNIYDMLAQAYMQVSEVYPAVAAALKATKLAPRWWAVHQTLGRAHLGLGEVELAVKSFSRAIHLQPDQQELWNDDLKWAASLLAKHRELLTSKLQETKTEENPGLTLEDAPFECYDEAEPCMTKHRNPAHSENFTDRRFQSPENSPHKLGEEDLSHSMDIDFNKLVCYKK